MRFTILFQSAGLLVSALFLLSGAASTSELSPLLLDGKALHATLETPRLDSRSARHVSRDVLAGNPQLSSDADFIRAIASSGSQGNLGGEGIRAALYALYVAEKDVGLYGLEASSTADADRIERILRQTWAHNVSIDRARVHRQGRALVVVWTDGLAPEVWTALNAAVAERLSLH